MNQTGLDQEALAPMMMALLKERFKLTYHTEQRDLPAYALQAVKPKMKKAILGAAGARIQVRFQERRRRRRARKP